MKTIDCVQGSPEWFQARRGVPTASRFDQIMSPVKKQFSKSATTLAYELIGELSYPGPVEDLHPGMSQNMRNGASLEDEARRAYSLVSNNDVTRAGFVMDDFNQFGCSPDGFVGDDGALELKCPMHKTQAEYLHLGKVPADYLCQVHGTLIVTGRKWIDFMSYARGLPPLVVRVEPNDFTEALNENLIKFWELFTEIREAIAKKGK